MHNNPKLMGHSEGSPERGVHSNTVLPKENTKFSNKLPQSKRTRGTTTNRARASRRKEIIKIRAKLNGIETKRTIQMIYKSRSYLLKR